MRCLPLWGRWPSEARSDEVLPLRGRWPSEARSDEVPSPPGKVAERSDPFPWEEGAPKGRKRNGTTQNRKKQSYRAEDPTFPPISLLHFAHKISPFLRLAKSRLTPVARLHAPAGAVISQKSVPKSRFLPASPRGKRWVVALSEWILYTATASRSIVPARAFPLPPILWAAPGGYSCSQAAPTFQHR